MRAAGATTARSVATDAADERADKPGRSETKPKPREKERAGLSFTEKHRLDSLPAVMARLEAEIGKLGALLSDPELFSREPVKFRKATEALTERQAALAAAEEEWLLLEEKAAG